MQLTALDAKRMAVGELFRDGKCGRHGFGLRHTQVITTARPDRLILILASAHMRLTVGRRMWDRIDEPPELLTRQVVAATLTSAGNWG